MRLITGITCGKINDAELFWEMLKTYEGKRIDITITRHTEKRTTPQNKYYWGVIIKLIRNFSLEKGYDFTEDDWHEYIISKGYFGYKDSINGRRAKRSHEATTIEFNEAIEKLQRDWAIKGLILPDPNQSDFLED